MALTKPASWRVGLVKLHQWRDQPACSCLHVQLEDGNLGDGFFDTPTRREIELRQHSVCLTLFDLLASMSLTQRKKLSAAPWGVTPSP